MLWNILNRTVTKIIKLRAHRISSRVQGDFREVPSWRSKRMRFERQAELIAETQDFIRDLAGQNEAGEVAQKEAAGEAR